MSTWRNTSPRAKALDLWLLAAAVGLRFLRGAALRTVFFRRHSGRLRLGFLHLALDNGRLVWDRAAMASEAHGMGDLRPDAAHSAAALALSVALQRRPRHPGRHRVLCAGLAVRLERPPDFHTDRRPRQRPHDQACDRRAGGVLGRAAFEAAPNFVRLK